jgi:hypothetical protein
MRNTKPPIFTETYGFPYRTSSEHMVLYSFTGDEFFQDLSLQILRNGTAYFLYFAAARILETCSLRKWTSF